MSTSMVGKSYRNRKAALFLLLFSLVVIGFTLPGRAGDREKDEDTLTIAGNVFGDMVNNQSIPQDVISKADCILILPSVKKFSIGIGGSGGRGPLVCPSGSSFTGKWSAPAMYSVGGVSAGLQLGGMSTDYVLLIMTEKGVNAVLNGKTKLGRDAAAAAGPSGANAGAVSGNDILSYGRSKGLFAGVSLGSASLDPDGDANQRLYGKSITPRETVGDNNVQPPSGSQGMLSLLDSKEAKPSD
jgi:SH3 domain-containing YSC84-like protein 1